MQKILICFLLFFVLSTYAREEVSSDDPAIAKISGDIDERIKSILSRIPTNGEPTLLLRVESKAERIYFCAPECLVLFKPDGELWLMRKIKRKKPKPELLGTWRYENFSLELSVPASKRFKIAQQYVIPFAQDRIPQWLGKTRWGYYSLEIERGDVFVDGNVTAGEEQAVALVVDTTYHSRLRRGIKFGDDSLRRVIANGMLNAVREQVKEESEAKRLAEKERKETEEARRVEERKAAVAKRKRLNMLVAESLDVSQLKSLELKKIQQALLNAGYKAGVADGDWGKRSAAALRKWLVKNRSIFLNQTMTINFNELTGKAPRDQILIYDAEGDVIATLDCDPGEALFYGGNLVPCGTIVQR